MTRAVIVIELDVVENSTDLTDAARVVGEAGVPGAVRLHLAIRDAADSVLAAFTPPAQSGPEGGEQRG